MLPKGCEHRLADEPMTKSKSITYNSAAHDPLVGKRRGFGEETQVSKRRATLQCAAWACDWFLATEPNITSEEQEACETTIATEMSLYLIGS